MQNSPIKQKKADAVYRIIAGDERIAMAVVFGSSLNLRCNIRSDLDIAIKLKEPSIQMMRKMKYQKKYKLHVTGKQIFYGGTGSMNLIVFCMKSERGVILR